MKKQLCFAVVLLGMLAASLGMAPAADAKTRKVRLQLDWVIMGYHAGFFVAKDKGFYKSKGLEVSIGRGYGSGDTAKVVASGASEFGLMSVPTQIISRGKGAPVVTISAVMSKAPESFLSFEEKGIKSIKDVEGKTFAEAPGSAMLVEWPAFTKLVGLDPSKIKLISIEPAAKGAVFFSGKVDFVAGWRPGFDEPIILRARKEGKKLRFIRWEDHGWKVYGSGLGTSVKLLKSDPKLVRDFVSASMDGYAYMISHPKEALNIVMKNNPEMSRDTTWLSLLFGIDGVATANAKKNGLGWLEPDRMKFMIDTMSSLLKFAPPKPQDMYTNQFITKKAYTISPELKKELANLP